MPLIIEETKIKGIPYVHRKEGEKRFESIDAEEISQKARIMYGIGKT